MGREGRAWEKLLLAANQQQKRRTPFSAEELTLAAWRAYPDAFGFVVDGESYPDSHRVAMEIMGSKPLRGKGYIEKVGTKLYRVTSAGELMAERLVGDPGEQRSKAQLGRQDRERLRRLLESRALQKVLSGRDDEVTFHDACVFWGLSPRSSANAFRSKFAGVEGLIATAKLASSGDYVSLEHGGKGFGPSELQALERLNRDLRERFADELAVILERTDERR